MRWLSFGLLVFATGCALDDEPAGYDPNYCPKVEEWAQASASFEDEVARLVNQRRNEGGVCGGESFPASSPLGIDAKLRCAARSHSLDMATRGYFAHESPDGEDAADRITRAGFEWTAIGENIARGQPTPDEVMADWMASPGHCANILEPRFEFVGVGFVDDGAFWTQTFGAP